MGLLGAVKNFAKEQCDSHIYSWYIYLCDADMPERYRRVCRRYRILAEYGADAMLHSVKRYPKDILWIYQEALRYKKTASGTVTNNIPTNHTIVSHSCVATGPPMNRLRRAFAV